MIIVLITLSVLYGLLISIYGVGWRKLDGTTKPTKNSTRVSVIVPIRNEEENIVACLKSIEQQSYSKDLTEIIVVNDGSEDRSASIVFCFENVKLISLEQNEGKKAALTKGIHAASGDLIITTDGDCVAEKDWIQSIVSFKQISNAKMIASPVRFIKPNSFLEKFQCLDFMAMQGITGASNYWDVGNMSNGANLAFEKNVFNEVEGYRGNEHIASGDDFFLMNKVIKKYPGQVHFLKSKSAVVSTKAISTLKAFINQRIRWASKMKRNADFRLVLVLVFLFVYHILLPIAFVAGLCGDQNLRLAAVVAIMFKCLVDYMFLYPLATFFDQRSILKSFLPAQALNYFYIVIIGLLSIPGRYEWKGRVINQ